MVFSRTIINLLLQTENILKKFSGIISLKDVIRTGGSVKPTYFVKKSYGEKLKLFEKKNVNIVHENTCISKFQIYFSETSFLYQSVYEKLRIIQ